MSNFNQFARSSSERSTCQFQSAHWSHSEVIVLQKAYGISDRIRRFICIENCRWRCVCDMVGPFHWIILQDVLSRPKKKWTLRRLRIDLKTYDFDLNSPLNWHQYKHLSIAQSLKCCVNVRPFLTVHLKFKRKKMLQTNFVFNFDNRNAIIAIKSCWILCKIKCQSTFQAAIFD